MKYCVIILFFGLAVQLEASPLHQADAASGAADQEQHATDPDVEADGHVRVNRSVQSAEERKRNVLMASENARRTMMRCNRTPSNISERSRRGSSKHEKTGSDVRRSHKKQRRSADSQSDNQVLAFGLDTGAPEKKNELVEAISETFGHLELSPNVRANDYGEKNPPVALELKSDAILQVVENFLASPDVKQLTRDLARKAAIIYRSFEKEF